MNRKYKLLFLIQLIQSCNCYLAWQIIVGRGRRKILHTKFQAVTSMVTNMTYFLSNTYLLNSLPVFSTFQSANFSFMVVEQTNKHQYLVDWTDFISTNVVKYYVLQSVCSNTHRQIWIYVIFTNGKGLKFHNFVEYKTSWLVILTNDQVIDQFWKSIVKLKWQILATLVG